MNRSIPAGAGRRQSVAAVSKGFDNAAHVRKDADPDARRQRDDFKKLLVELDKLLVEKGSGHG